MDYLVKFRFSCSVYVIVPCEKCLEYINGAYVLFKPQIKKLCEPHTYKLAVMDCYDAFDEVVEDFKYLVDHREGALRKLETKLSENSQEEQNVIRRLEHQISLLKTDLFLGTIMNETSSSATCASCRLVTY